MASLYVRRVNSAPTKNGIAVFQRQFVKGAPCESLLPVCPSSYKRFFFLILLLINSSIFCRLPWMRRKALTSLSTNPVPAVLNQRLEDGQANEYDGDLLIF